MLSIGALGSAEYYLAEARYYLGEKEFPSGYWLGDARNQLNLPDVVEGNALKALFEGFMPKDAGRKLVQNAGNSKRKLGWDLTFSAPKSVSVLWALVPKLRPTLLQAHRVAVERAYSYLETKAAFTRRGKGGSTREPCRLVAAAFEHWTTRAGDPGVHTHMLVVNLGLRRDMSWGSILSEEFFSHKMAAGAIYRDELAHQLKQKLSLALRPVGCWFEVASIPNSVIRHFSTRRREILAAVGPEATAAEAAKAALTTRRSKKRVSLSSLEAKWAAEGKTLGLDPDSMLTAAVNSWKAPKTIGQETIWEHALEKMTGLTSKPEPEPSKRFLGETSHFTQADLVRGVAEQAAFLGTPSNDVLSIVEKRQKELVLLTEPGKPPCYTTRQMLKLRDLLVSQTKELTERNTHDVPMELVKSVVDRPTRRRQFTDHERQAIEKLTRGGSDLAMLTGIPNAERMDVVKACRKIWERAGYKVLGASLSAKAAQELKEQAGIATSTVASRLKQHESKLTDAVKHHLKQFWRGFNGKNTWRHRAEKITSNTVVVVDEAARLGMWEMQTVVSRCREVGAKLVLLGEPVQRSRGAEPPFKWLLDTYPSARCPEVLRHREVWGRDAANHISQGNIPAALEIYAHKGLVKVDSTEKVHDRLVQDWAKEGLRAPRSTLIFTGTREEAAKINELCQRARKEARWLPNWPSVRVGEERLYAGDRVRFTQNHGGLKVGTGDLGTVQSINPLKGIVRIKLDREEGLFIKRRRTVEVPLKYYKHLELGYAVTSHVGQWPKLESSFMLLSGGLTENEPTFLQASRARSSTAIYIDSSKVGAAICNMVARHSVPPNKDLAEKPLGQMEPPKPATNTTPKPEETKPTLTLDSRKDLTPADTLGRTRRIDDQLDQLEKLLLSQKSSVKDKVHHPNVPKLPVNDPLLRRDLPKDYSHGTSATRF